MRALRSANQILLDVPETRGNRAFGMAAPWLWNRLICPEYFKSLKTDFFSLGFLRLDQCSVPILNQL